MLPWSKNKSTPTNEIQYKGDNDEQRETKQVRMRPVAVLLLAFTIKALTWKINLNKE